MRQCFIGNNVSSLLFSICSVFVGIFNHLVSGWLQLWRAESYCQYVWRSWKVSRR